MQTKQRISISLPIELTHFVQSFSKKQQTTQSAVVQQALAILKKIQEEQELKNAYVADQNSDNSDEFVDVFFNDCLKDES